MHQSKYTDDTDSLQNSFFTADHISITTIRFRAGTHARLCT